MLIATAKIELCSAYLQSLLLLLVCGRRSYGSSSRCCYNKIGNLMYSGDTINGSTSQRADPSGLAPYGTSPNIPSISNWQIDLLPWYYCCVWQNNPYDCFNLYMNVRPTQDCKNYNVPGHGKCVPMVCMAEKISDGMLMRFRRERAISIFTSIISLRVLLYICTYETNVWKPMRQSCPG